MWQKEKYRIHCSLSRENLWRYVCDTHSYMWHDSFTWHDPFICGTWLICMWDMNHLSIDFTWRYVCDTRGGAILCVTCEWVISMNDMGHIYTVYTYMYCLYDTHTWLIHMWSMTRVTYIPSIRHVTCEWVVSHVNESCENLWRYICDTKGRASLYVTCEWVMSHMKESCRIL